MVVFVAILVSMLSVDILGYYFLPPQYSEALPGYRFGDAYLAMGHPKGYFRRDAQLGFDIEANARATDHFDGITYSIFSNSVGCFDEREIADFQSNNWVYFGGDSFTWGFAPYKKKICDSIREADGDKNGEMWRPTHGHATRVRKIQVDHSTDRFISPVVGVRRILR
jgi:hypothetical protein